MIELENVSVSINGKALLENISFKVLKNSIVCVLGKNGSGKSTLLRTILGNLDYTGSCKIKGLENRSLNEKKRAQIISYVPQNQHIIFPFTLLEVVLMGKFAKSSLFAYTRTQKSQAYYILESFGIAHLANRLFYSLSGGEKQLGLIARALISDNEIIVLDEPVSALDISYSFKLLDLIANFKDKTIILSSHFPEQCFIADKILMIKAGRIFRYASRAECLQTPYIDELYDINTTATALPNSATYFSQFKTKL
ncbi:ABC transporter ATP-binding protein [Campylobacter troglodytis]|uniref:ABC transporter ATP-binding protein n=1 Tax=Campylobacter troglodytis TaxID=654363 RepID=UPI00115B1C29|nr:ABC transporter ATP-binding protein [Campylobacter troglodytis]TQR60753.1 hypothetical protein DMC01_04415 [Campylobacter troglodytis]